jgi:hypothetical protein
VSPATPSRGGAAPTAPIRITTNTAGHGAFGSQQPDDPLGTDYLAPARPLVAVVTPRVK